MWNQPDRLVLMAFKGVSGRSLEVPGLNNEADFAASNLDRSFFCTDVRPACC